jgi:hypothetical protein
MDKRKFFGGSWQLTSKEGVLMKWLGIMFMAALLALAPGLGSAQQSKDTPAVTQPQGPEVKKEAAAPAKSFTPAERQAYEKKTASDLDTMEKRVGDLVVKVREVVPQRRREVMKIMRGLQTQALAARNQLTALEKAPENSWGALKPGMDRTMAELRKTWEVSALYLQ